MIQPTCPHQDLFGGVSTSFDGYSVRPKVGLREYPFQFYCWPCYETPAVQSFADAVEAETAAAIQQAGWCGFVEAWIGPCETIGPCAKHGSQRCWSCKGKATQNCSETGALVCGMPECGEHSHTEVHERRQEG